MTYKNIFSAAMVAVVLIGNAILLPNQLIAQTENDPIAVCQDITKMLNANGTLNVNPAELDGGSYDLNGPVTFTADINYLFCEHLGENSVTLLVSDNEGYVSVCTANVTVIDLIPPTALCKDIAINLDENDQASIGISDVDNGSTDNCNIVDMYLSKTTFTASNLGANNVILTLTDDSGNSNECVSVVHVAEAPKFNPHDILAAIISPTQEELGSDIAEKGSEINMNLFPNPALHGQTTIVLENMVKGQKDITIILYDIFGVAVRHERLSESDIELKVKLDSLDTLKSGVYAVHVNIDGKTLSEQLIVR